MNSFWVETVRFRCYLSNCFNQRRGSDWFSIQLNVWMCIFLFSGSRDRFPCKLLTMTKMWFIIELCLGLVLAFPYCVNTFSPHETNYLSFHSYISVKKLSSVTLEVNIAFYVLVPLKLQK